MAGAEKVGQMTEVETHGTGSTDFHRIPRLSHEGDGQQMATDTLPHALLQNGKVFAYICLCMLMHVLNAYRMAWFLFSFAMV